MTKHRLMLSAATAALFAGALIGHAAADTDITTNTHTALSTSTAGNITIETNGSVAVQAAGPAITINSNAGLGNNGAISNADTSNALGVLIDTSGGNIVESGAGLLNVGTIDLTGKGSGKTAIAISGGNTYFGPLSLVQVVTPVTTTTGQATVTSGGSSILVQGAGSSALALAQFTTFDGDMSIGGPVSMATTLATDAGGTLVYLGGNLNGNFTVLSGSSLTNVGRGAVGIAAVGNFGACDSTAMAGVHLSCATGSSGALNISGTVAVAGTTLPDAKAANPESGSAVVIGSSLPGGFLINGPKTALANVATASISGNGATSSAGSSPVVLIDPSQSSASINLGVVSPLYIGPVQTALDPADGISGQNGGFSIINHGAISAVPIDTDVATIAMVITGQSPTNITCLSGAAGSCVTSVSGKAVGGLLNTGTLVARAVTKEDTNSGLSANALTVGAYATVPRLVVAGETTTGTTTTTGQIAATVTGPGGGIATAVTLSNFATVPEIDVLTHGVISASVGTTTVSPSALTATPGSPFTEFAAAILDQSGSLKTINNAGIIAGLNQPLTPAAGAVVVNTQHAIDLLANTSGGITINNSGNIEGDIFFGAAGGGDVLNVGNISAGSANAATGLTNTPFQYATVSGRVIATNAGAAPTTEANVISFGSGAGQSLHVGGFGYVNSIILAQAASLDVTVDPNGQLFVGNTSATGPLFARNFDVNGGVLGLSISQGTSSTTPVVSASNEATLGPNARIGLQFGTFISSGTTTASVNNPTVQAITLISAPVGKLNVSDTTLATDNAVLVPAIPFLFESPAETGSKAPQPLSLSTSGGNQTLLLSFLPRAPGAKNADGTAGLGLSGDALALFPNIAAALSNDPRLGAAIAGNITVTNGTGTPVLDVASSQVRAQQVFSRFTPDVSGGTRQVAILLTDQATGPVAARQRLLNSYANQTGELSLWGQEFAGMINNKGKLDADGSLTAYKDHGWGFAVGMDAGSAQNGWYGGALTFYSGDVTETSPRASIAHQEWYILTAYSDWRGKHVFIDGNFDIGYGSLTGHRGLAIGDQSREATGKRAALLGSIGGSAGAYYNYGKFQFIPHISLDALSMREEGYTETNGGAGMDLQLAPYYANSLRAFLGSDVKTELSVFNFTLIPEARLGYRYDFIASPVKLKGGFLSTGGLSTPSNVVSFIGPDPDTGNIVAGASVSAGTDTWSVGFHYDWLRGNNGSTTQSGILTLLGRI